MTAEGSMNRAAMVILRADGRWEVQVSESENTSGLRRWKHRSIFETEQEAEIFARSILPYSCASWENEIQLDRNLPKN